MRLRHRGMWNAARSGGVTGISLNLASLNSRVFAYYKMDEASGDRADSGSGALTLTDNNTVTQAAGAKIGNAAQFTKANLEFLSSASASFARGDTDWSYVTWLYADTLPGAAENHSVLSKDNAVNDRGYFLTLNGDAGPAYQFLVYDGASTQIGGVTDPQVIGDGAWHMLACGHRASSNDVWISTDAAAKTVAATTGAAGDSATDLQIGALVSILSWSGRMDETAFFNTDVSATELAYLYNSGDGRTYPFT